MSTREELTRQAERSLRQGRLDDALGHYQALAALEPVDWGVVKLHADLLERGGQREAAAAQFVRWADYLFAEGFHSKAAALYKKVLKLEAAHEHALWQLADVSLALKLTADARAALVRVVQLRERRGDAAGVAAARERLDGIASASPVAAVPRAAVPPTVTPLEAPQAPVVSVPVVPAPPVSAVELPAVLVAEPAAHTACAIAEDDLSPPEATSARDVPAFEPPTIPHMTADVDLSLDVAALAAPAHLSIPDDGVSAALPRLPNQSYDWADLLGRDVQSPEPDVSHEASVMPEVSWQKPHASCVTAATPWVDDGGTAAVAGATAQDTRAEVRGDEVVPDVADEIHVAPTSVLSQVSDLQPALTSADDPMPSFSTPRSWFSDAVEPADPVEPTPPSYLALFESDAEQLPPRWAVRTPVTAPSPPPNTAAAFAAEVPTVEPPAPSSSEEIPAEPATPELVEEEVDLTDLLEQLQQWDTVLPDPPVRPAPEPAPSPEPATSGDPAPLDRHQDHDPPEPVPAPASDDGSDALEAAFTEMHLHADGRVIAEQQLAAGRVFLAAGLVSEAARAFERASLEPRTRFGATQALAELHRSRGQLAEAVGWYEHAAMAPVPDAAVKRTVLYDLAESLEALGESDRALGVLLDLLSQVEDYRDARARLDRLLRVDAGG